MITNHGKREILARAVTLIATGKIKPRVFYEDIGSVRKVRCVSALEEARKELDMNTKNKNLEPQITATANWNSESKSAHVYVYYHGGLNAIELAATMASLQESILDRIQELDQQWSDTGHIKPGILTEMFKANVKMIQQKHR